MSLYLDPAVNPEKDARRQEFEKLMQLGAVEKLEGVKRMVANFVANGHNPKDPNDEMFEILGISPEFLELMMFSLEKEANAPMEAFQNSAEVPAEIAAAIPSADIQPENKAL